jgi:hypothetical protein
VDDEVYLEILNDYRQGRLTPEEAAQEVFDTLRARNEPLNIQVGKDVQPVFEILGRLVRNAHPPS